MKSGHRFYAAHSFQQNCLNLYFAVASKLGLILFQPWRKLYDSLLSLGIIIHFKISTTHLDAELSLTFNILFLSSMTQQSRCFWVSRLKRLKHDNLRCSNNRARCRITRRLKHKTHSTTFVCLLLTEFSSPIPTFWDSMQFGFRPCNNIDKNVITSIHSIVPHI